MALDFPSNPIDGQVSGNYIWSASSGVWKSKASINTVSVISSTAPATGNQGDIWVDSTDGSSYYYLDDGTSKQWVELISSGIPSTPVAVSSGGTGSSLGVGLAPTGSVMQFAVASAPTGWLLCNGGTFSSSTYPALAALLGDTYGVHSGTTYYLPDLRGRVPVGAGSVTDSASQTQTFNLADKSGELKHTLSVAEMPVHTHTDSGHVHSNSLSRQLQGTDDGNYTSQTSRGDAGTPDTLTWNTATGYANIQSAGGSGGVTQAHNILQPYIVLNYIIKT